MQSLAGERFSPPPPTALHVQISTDLEIGSDEAVQLYAHVEGWKDLFPATIESAHIIASGETWVDVEVHHRFAGLVPNTLVFGSPTTVWLTEKKPRYNAWFLNSFRPTKIGTCYVLSGWVDLHGVLRLLTPILGWYVRRVMARQMNQFVLIPFARRCQTIVESGQGE